MGVTSVIAIVASVLFVGNLLLL